MSLCPSSWPMVIPEMGKSVQEAVRNAIESMTGLEVAAVNISVGGIVFPQKEP